MHFNVKDKISSIEAQTLVIHGTDDKLVDVSNGDDIAKRIPITVQNIRKSDVKMNKFSTATNHLCEAQSLP